MNEKCFKIFNLDYDELIRNFEREKCFEMVTLITQANWKAGGKIKNTDLTTSMVFENRRKFLLNCVSVEIKKNFSRLYRRNSFNAG